MWISSEGLIGCTAGTLSFGSFTFQAYPSRVMQIAEGKVSCSTSLLARIDCCHSVYVLLNEKLLCSDFSGSEMQRFRAWL